MSQNVSDEELDNARQEVEFWIRQIPELEPWARQIKERRSSDGSYVSILLNEIETDRWNEQYMHVLFKIVEAQNKYIKLLEKRIGK
jgi:hypothetical protein